MFRRSYKLANSSISVAKRKLHEVPALKNQDAFLQNGIEGLYSPKGFKSAWSDYQKYLTFDSNITNQWH